MFDIIAFPSLQRALVRLNEHKRVDTVISSTHSQKKKNWLKEKNLYKFREEKKFLASSKT